MHLTPAALAVAITVAAAEPLSMTKPHPPTTTDAPTTTKAAGNKTYGTLPFYELGAGLRPISAVASIITSDASATTATVTCAPSERPNGEAACSISQPLTVTIAPSTQRIAFVPHSAATLHGATVTSYIWDCKLLGAPSATSANCHQTWLGEKESKSWQMVSSESYTGDRVHRSGIPVTATASAVAKTTVAATDSTFLTISSGPVPTATSTSSSTDGGAPVATAIGFAGAAGALAAAAVMAL